MATAVLWLQCSIYELRKLPNRCQVSEEVAPSRGSGFWRELSAAETAATTVLHEPATRAAHSTAAQEE
uniref:HDC04918 n=1 Tax=Drosophila melanogaster TaxID=7227 RepID=Q6IGW0_DROME|nr:TPA_inf: HDC04918 [Drosophila melanogaster]